MGIGDPLVSLARPSSWRRSGCRLRWRGPGRGLENGMDGLYSDSRSCQ